MIENGKDKIEWSRKVDESKVWLDLFISYIPISIHFNIMVSYVDIIGLCHNVPII